MMRVAQCCSRVFSLVSKHSIIHQASRGQRLPIGLQYCLRKTPLVFANSSIRFFRLTPTNRWDLFGVYVASKVTSAVQSAWSTAPSISALSPAVGHPIMERSDEIKKLEEALKKQNKKQVATVYLVGEPGIGKSQLARKYGETYYNSYYFPRSKTALMLDMSNFEANYSNLAISIGVQPDVANDWKAPKKIAQEVKKILSNRASWLLILDEYNSLTYDGFDRGTVHTKETMPYSYMYY